MSAKLIPTFLGLTLLLLVAAPAAMAVPARASQSVELLHGTVRPLAHSARGRAAVVRRSDGSRVLTLSRFSIDPGPRVRVWLVPRAAKGDGQFRRSYVDLGRLKGSRGNQQYTIPRRTDLRRFNAVVFWCVPFTQGLARAALVRS